MSDINWCKFFIVQPICEDEILNLDIQKITGSDNIPAVVLTN